jgi:hypothetical protein
MVSGTAAWAADAPTGRAPPRAAGPPGYKLDYPHLVAATRAPAIGKSLALADALKAGALSDVDLRLRSRWLVDPRASFADDRFYSLEEQVAYFVAHEPGLVVTIPESLSRAPSRIELATLELHLPF